MTSDMHVMPNAHAIAVTARQGQEHVERGRVQPGRTPLCGERRPQQGRDPAVLKVSVIAHQHLLAAAPPLTASGEPSPKVELAGGGTDWVTLNSMVASSVGGGSTALVSMAVLLFDLSADGRRGDETVGVAAPEPCARRS